MFPDQTGDGASKPFILLTCEHGGRDVPAAYADCFIGAESVLESHRGYDIGSLGVAHRMAARLSVPIVFSTVTRLLVDLNRSIGQADLLSEFTRDLPEQKLDTVLAEHYTPYRQSVERVVQAAVCAGHTVLHFGVHSCVDRLNDQDRDLDVSLLFDETRERESALCEHFRSKLKETDDRLRCPFNVPYRGSDDGLTTTLRDRFKAYEYLGIEIELRQGLVSRAVEQNIFGDMLAHSLLATLSVLFAYSS